MSALPIWFGDTDRPLLGWFHLPPSGQVRAGVVICPPLGIEYLQAHFTLRLLAEQLAEAGLGVLRFDYDGTGDSAGDGRDPDRVASWLGSVESAISFVRSAGIHTVIAVGMRMGALLAGVVAERDAALGGLVLWDPVVSGRAFLTQQKALSALTFDIGTTNEDGSIEAPGVVFDGETVRQLRDLDLTRSTGPLAQRVHILCRPDRATSKLRVRFDLPHVDWSDADGQSELMDVDSENLKLPHVAIDRVAKWIIDVAPVGTDPIRVPESAGPAVVACGPSGDDVVETPTFVGPAGLFGVLTEAVGRRHAGPTMLFLNVGTEHGIGPSRLWVDLARTWALAGIRSFRLDLSGLGDSPTRQPDQARFVVRAPEAFDDVADAAKAISPHDPSDVVLIGLCSSAYQSIDSTLGLQTRGILAINPVLSFEPPELASGLQLDPRRQCAMPRSAVVRVFHGQGRLAPLRARFPNLAWSVRTLASPRRRSASWLRRLVRQGTHVVLICGEDDARPIRAGASPRLLGSLGRSGRFHFDVIEELDHSLLISSQRAAVAELMTNHALVAFTERPLSMASVIPTPPESRAAKAAT